MALAPGFADLEIEKLDKCVINGKIIKITDTNDIGCIKGIEIAIKGKNGYYKINSVISYGNCPIDSIYDTYGNNFYSKNGMNMKFIVEKNKYDLISSKDHLFKKYSSLKECNPNISETKELKELYSNFIIKDYKDLVFNSNHYILYIGLSIILICIVLTFKLWKKNIKQ